MQVVDHEPHAWFLFKEGNDLLLDVNCNHGPAGYSVMIQLSEEEEAEYSKKGHAYLNWLAQAVQDSGPGRGYQLRDVSTTYSKESIAKSVEQFEAVAFKAQGGGKLRARFVLHFKSGQVVHGLYEEAEPSRFEEWARKFLDSANWGNLQTQTGMCLFLPENVSFVLVELEERRKEGGL